MAEGRQRGESPGRARAGTCRSRALGQTQLPFPLTPPDPRRDTEG